MLAATIPGRVGLTLVVDPQAVARGPLVRGRGPAFRAERRAGAELRITAPALQRQGFRRVLGPPPSHLDAFATAHPDRRPLAVVGCGNLGPNPGVLAATGDGVLGTPGPWNGALAIEAAGLGRALGVQAALAAPAGGFAISGPLLVRDGRSVPPDPAVFADPRHLLRFPFVQVRSGARVDFGLDELLADPARLAEAVRGAPVELSLELRLPVSTDVQAALQPVPVELAELERALATKGYRAGDPAAGRGRFHLAPARLRIAFLEGIYPHHALALREDGSLASVLVGGASNRSGVTVADLAAGLVAAGFREAILLDNGGDVGLWLPGEQRFAIRPAESDRSETWPLSACLVYAELPACPG
jgi:hypothetical protein